MKTTTMHLAPAVAQNKVSTEKRIIKLLPGRHARALAASKEVGVPSVDDAKDIFTHAPVSLWEEDFSEVKRRFDQLRANGVEDLRKHFQKHPEEVLSLARMVRITRVNEETLKLYDAAGPAEFQEGLSLIFNKDSFEIFKEEVIAFWKGRTSFSSEAVNVTLTGTNKNILLSPVMRKCTKNGHEKCTTLRGIPHNKAVPSTISDFGRARWSVRRNAWRYGH